MNAGSRSSASGPPWAGTWISPSDPSTRSWLPLHGKVWSSGIGSSV